MELPVTLSPSLVYAGLSYLLVFRLAIILLGGMTIYLGYRLFSQKLPVRRDSDEKGELAVKFGNNEMTLRSVGPGIFFAAFGCLLVVVVLAGNPPDFKLLAEQNASGDQRTVAEFRSDGDMPIPFKETMDDFYKNHLICEELAEHAKRIAGTPEEKAESLTILASIYFLSGKLKEAIQFQENALKELPENLILLKRLEAYQTAL